MSRKKQPERTNPLVRSIFSLMVLIAVVGITYSYEENLFREQWDSITTSSTKKELPIYSVKTEKPQVAISFDAAWGNEDTQKILDTLKKYNVKATFFMTGGWVESYPEDVKNIYKAGHDLGNHSEHHKHMSELTYNDVKQEIDTVTKKVQDLTGQTMQLFRPPYGDYDNQLIYQLKDCGYYPIQWSVDSLDWKNYGVNNVIDTILNHKNLKNGAIILMHNGAKYTAQALPKIIEGLQAKGFELVPISQLIYKDNYHIEVDGCQVYDEPNSTTGKIQEITEQSKKS